MSTYLHSHARLNHLLSILGTNPAYDGNPEDAIYRMIK